MRSDEERRRRDLHGVEVVLERMTA